MVEVDFSGTGGGLSKLSPDDDEVGSWLSKSMDGLLLVAAFSRGNRVAAAAPYRISGEVGRGICATSGKAEPGCSASEIGCVCP